MCAVSMVGDFWQEKWDPWKKYIPNQPISIPSPSTDPYKDWEEAMKKFNPLEKYPTKQEFEDLKKEVEIMKGLLKKAKIYDEQNNEPNCEMDEKVKLLKQIAALVGVDLEEIFKSK